MSKYSRFAHFNQNFELISQAVTRGKGRKGRKGRRNRVIGFLPFLPLSQCHEYKEFTLMLEKDRAIIRDLAKQVVEVAELPIMAERKEIWKRHHGLERVRPMILVFPENSWRELIPEATLECEEQFARGIERNLRTRLYYHEYIHDDTVIEKTYIVDKAVWHTGWGLEPKFVLSSINPLCDIIF